MQYLRRPIAVTRIAYPFKDVNVSYALSAPVTDFFSPRSWPYLADDCARVHTVNAVFKTFVGRMP